MPCAKVVINIDRLRGKKSFLNSKCTVNSILTVCIIPLVSFISHEFVSIFHNITVILDFIFGGLMYGAHDPQAWNATVRCDRDPYEIERSPRQNLFLEKVLLVRTQFLFVQHHCPFGRCKRVFIFLESSFDAHIVWKVSFKMVRIDFNRI